MEFCAGGWSTRPETSSRRSFDCQVASTRWEAQRLLSEDSENSCPHPEVVPWPPSKHIFPLCSKAVRSLGREHHSLGLEHHDGVSARFIELQGTAAAQGFCPSPKDHLWVPDHELYPECDRWLRVKCRPGDPCDVPSSGHWSQVSTRAAHRANQDWCAGRHLCPHSTEFLFVPGPHFYPKCTQAALLWCHKNGLIKECSNPLSPLGTVLLSEGAFQSSPNSSLT